MKQPIVRIGRKVKSLFKRSAPLAMGTLFMAGLLLNSMPSPTATAASVQNLTPSPRVSFTFDDGLTSAVQYAAPTLAAHGLTGSSYIITGCVGMTATPNTCAADNNKTYMSWDQIAQLHTMGWEIGSHTVTHPQLAIADGTKDGSLKGGAAQVITELANSQQALKDHGYDASDLALPYGDYDNNTLVQAAKYYESTRGFADLGYNTWPYDGTLVVNEQVQEGKTVGNISGATLAQVKGYIDTAIANNQWLVLTFHNVTPTTPASADDYSTSTALLDQIAAYVQQQQTAGKIKSVNVTDGMVRGTNLLANGDFANGIANGWTTDDAAYITADANNNGRYPEATHSISLKSNPSANANSRDGESHLFSPKVNVAFGKTYVLKNYLSMVSGGSVTFYVDEYDANGNWISGKDPNASRTFSTAANPINVGDLNFTYTPTSANVASASLQVIVRHGTNVQAYLDESQWFDTSEVLAPADTTPPVVSNVTITNTTATGATISWTTDEPSTGTLNYGTTASYGQSASASTLSTTHSVTLTGLTASTNYQYQIVAKDAAGNTNSLSTGSFGTTANTTVLGDLTGDGKVNNDDATILFANWGSSPHAGDLTNDGVVNNDDATLLFANWSK